MEHEQLSVMLRRSQVGIDEGALELGVGLQLHVDLQLAPPADGHMEPGGEREGGGDERLIQHGWPSNDGEEGWVMFSPHLVLSSNETGARKNIGEYSRTSGQPTAGCSSLSSLEAALLLATPPRRPP